MFGSPPRSPLGMFGDDTTRRVFFSFHYQQDIWRVNVVRNSWRFGHEQSREAKGFFDASLWEKSKRNGDESIKSLIREGIKNSSVTCVLTGHQTWTRRWVRYEIARSVIKGNALLSVRIHNIRDQNGYLSQKGANPLDAMGVYLGPNGVLLAEWSNRKWIRYRDFNNTVTLPPSWPTPNSRSVIPLSRCCTDRCYVTDSGSTNFSSWVRAATLSVGR